MLLYRTNEIYPNIIKWWVLCALDRKCIAPIMHRFCKWPNGDKFNIFGECHKFDQSAINILLANLFDFDDWSYYAKVRIAKVEREQGKNIMLKFCKEKITLADDVKSLFGLG